MNPYVYIFVRNDIPYADIIVQASHACLEMGLGLPNPNKPKATASIVLLKARDEEHLLEIKQYIEMHEINSTIFFEPDEGMGYTAIATEPIYDRRGIFKKFRLWERN